MHLFRHRLWHALLTRHPVYPMELTNVIALLWLAITLPLTTTGTTPTPPALSVLYRMPGPRWEWGAACLAIVLLKLLAFYVTAPALGLRRIGALSSVGWWAILAISSLLSGTVTPITGCALGLAVGMSIFYTRATVAARRQGVP